MLPGASPVVHAAGLPAGPNRLWLIVALGLVVFHHSEVPLVAARSMSSHVAAEITSISGFNLYVSDDADVQLAIHCLQAPRLTPWTRQVSHIAIPRPQPSPVVLSRSPRAGHAPHAICEFHI